MKRRLSSKLRAQLSPRIDPAEVERVVAWFGAKVERNKTRRRRDGDPPAALPVPADGPKGGGLSGGAAAALVFDD